MHQDSFFLITFFSLKICQLGLRKRIFSFHLLPVAFVVTCLKQSHELWWNLPPYFACVKSHSDKLLLKAKARQFLSLFPCGAEASASRRYIIGCIASGIGSWRNGTGCEVSSEECNKLVATSCYGHRLAAVVTISRFTRVPLLALHVHSITFHGTPNNAW